MPLLIPLIGLGGAYFAGSQSKTSKITWLIIGAVLGIFAYRKFKK